MAAAAAPVGSLADAVTRDLQHLLRKDPAAVLAAVLHHQEVA